MSKKIKKLIMVAVLLFGMYNLFWIVTVNMKYRSYIIDMKEIHAYRTYAHVSEDGYTYNVKIPDYLSFVGNLGIQRSMDSNCALIIWPGLFSETEYGVFIRTEDGSSCGVMLTKEQEAVPGTPDQIKQLIESNKDQIGELFEKASGKWNLD